MRAMPFPALADVIGNGNPQFLRFRRGFGEARGEKTRGCAMCFGTRCRRIGAILQDVSRGAVVASRGIARRKGRMGESILHTPRAEAFELHYLTPRTGQTRRRGPLFLESLRTLASLRCADQAKSPLPSTAVDDQ